MNARIRKSTRLMLVQILALLLFCAGLGTLLYPSMQHLYHTIDAGNVIASYAHLQMTLSEERRALAHGETAEPAGENAGETVSERLLRVLASYNASLYADGQSTLCDPFSYEQAGIDLADYGMRDNVVGVLRVKSMEVELPVFLGATRENLRRGAALLGQTSMPIGGENTNAVIAAHRGYSGATMFRNIESAAVGDPVYLDGLFGTLEYRISETRVIDPSDIAAVLIQPGRDLLTLITCHPYRHNSQRYVVYCERAG